MCHNPMGEAVRALEEKAMRNRSNFALRFSMCVFAAARSRSNVLRAAAVLATAWTAFTSHAQFLTRNSDSDINSTSANVLIRASALFNFLVAETAVESDPNSAPPLTHVGDSSLAPITRRQFNIDIDTANTGGGAPGTSFAGAASQSGTWNSVSGTGVGPF